MTLTMSNFENSLKVVYSKEHVENLTYSDHPFFAMLKKAEDFGGKKREVAIQYGNPQGRSSTFSQAQTRGAATTFLLDSFELTRAEDNAIVSIPAQEIEASKGKENSFIEGLAGQIDGSIETLSRSISRKLYRDASGYVATVAEPADGVYTIALQKAGDIVHFEVGQQIEIYSAKSGGSLRIVATGVSTLTIVGVNRSSGIITTDVAYVAAQGTIVDGDYLFFKGDRGLSIAGLESWLPLVAPTSGDSFFGVDRSVDTRLSGNRYDASAVTMWEDKFINASINLAREGAKPDVCFVSYKDYASLQSELGVKVRYVQTKVTPEIGFSGIEIYGAKGNIKIIPDVDCPEGFGYMLQMDTWKFYSLGKAIRPVNMNGQLLTIASDSNSYEVRHVCWANLGCKAPGYNMVIKLTA